MEQKSGNFIQYMIIALVVIVVAGGAIILGINYFSQPSLPPASTGTPSTTSGLGNGTTGTGTTGTGTTGTGTTGTGTDNSGAGVSTPTQGGVSDGVITSICGGPSSRGGISDSNGTCGRCVNLNGTDGYCEPDSDEVVQVIGCAEKTGTDCDLEVDESAIIDMDGSDEVYISDYLEDACTLKVRVVAESEIEELTNTSAEQLDVEEIDYIVYQNDDCSEIEFDFAGLDLSDDDADNDDTPESNPVTPPPPASAPLLQCGDSCIRSIQCPTNHSCMEGTCTANVCIVNGVNTCDNNGCTLPNTAIFSDEIDIILFGTLLALIGVTVWRFGIDKELFLTFGGREFVMSESELEDYRREKLIKNTRDQRKVFADQVISNKE